MHSFVPFQCPSHECKKETVERHALGRARFVKVSASHRPASSGFFVKVIEDKQSSPVKHCNTGAVARVFPGLLREPNRVLLKQCKMRGPIGGLAPLRLQVLLGGFGRRKVFPMYNVCIFDLEDRKNLQQLFFIRIKGPLHIEAAFGSTA
ncbi:predicted protein [Histoplasma capsulatum var. duboisii H88]|uniref:Predicted protein n=1 Tax=Ajellomyces capsulatus (strain H88) TaxID=544711 RepID=F0UH44_AJEC8|nr:predicted protein [Histoplasma capsulatum var. duboisii H88]